MRLKRLVSDVLMSVYSVWMKVQRTGYICCQASYVISLPLQPHLSLNTSDAYVYVYRNIFQRMWSITVYINEYSSLFLLFDEAMFFLQHIGLTFTFSVLHWLIPGSISCNEAWGSIIRAVTIILAINEALICLLPTLPATSGGAAVNISCFSIGNWCLGEWTTIMPVKTLIEFVEKLSNICHLLPTIYQVIQTADLWPSGCLITKKLPGWHCSRIYSYLCAIVYIESTIVNNLYNYP